ncbi:MarR family transcriptional regulator [Nocardioides sp. YIM 152588]|uniref:MarR family winged helix-turn-helix transcriptional regulator n=1 Tax=Nocardioides sp. YIM 152588 TaxID=3158259 RepID=UPI0032E36F90
MPLRLADAPSWLLSRAHLRAQRLLSDGFAEHDLRPAHYRALAALAEGGLSQAELGRRLMLDRKDVTLAVDHLAERGLVDRSADPADRRRNVVTLTDAGRALLPRLEHTLESVQREVLAPLTEEEARTLTHLLRRLAPADEAAGVTGPRPRGRSRS